MVCSLERGVNRSRVEFVQRARRGSSRSQMLAMPFRVLSSAGESGEAEIVPQLGLPVLTWFSLS